MSKTYNKYTKGFTLIELLVVATIIVVLSAVGLVSFTNAGRTTRDGKRKTDLETVRQALTLYRSDNGEYPSPALGTGTARYTAVINLLLSGGYISAPTPEDPKDGEGVCGKTVCGYSYNAVGSGFTLQATLEKDGSLYSISNP